MGGIRVMNSKGVARIKKSWLTKDQMSQMTDRITWALRRRSRTRCVTLARDLLIH